MEDAENSGEEGPESSGEIGSPVLREVHLRRLAVCDSSSSLGSSYSSPCSAMAIDP